MNTVADFIERIVDDVKLIRGELIVADFSLELLIFTQLSQSLGFADSGCNWMRNFLCAGKLSVGI